MQVLQGSAVGPVVRPRFPERINAEIAQIGGGGVVIIDSPLFEVLVRHAVVVLASVCDELVGKDLGYPGAVGRAVRRYFPLVKVLFRVELHCEDGVVFGLQGGDEQVAAFALRNRGYLPKVKHVSVVGKRRQLEPILVVEVQNALLAQLAPQILLQVVIERRFLLENQSVDVMI